MESMGSSVLESVEDNIGVLRGEGGLRRAERMAIIA